MKHLLYFPKIMGGRPMRQLKRLAALTFALFCCLQTALAYDFSAVCSTGQTLYYTVTSGYGDYCVYVTYPNTNADPWGGYTKPTGNLEIPPYVVNGIISYTVKFIGTDAFRGCTGLTSVSTPSSTYQIGSGAFSGCTGLTSVGISEGVEYIISDAFSNCPHLTTVNINSSALVSSSYSYNTSTNDYDNLKKIFGNQVTSYIIGPNVHYVGENAFRGCSGMTSVTFPNTLTSIDNNAFRDCSNLVTANMPDVLLSIGTSAFHGCSSLSSIYISDDVTSIGWNAFFGCSSLTSVTIPNSVTNLGTAAFDNCFNLVQVTINSDAITSATYYSSSNLKKFFGNQVTRYTLGSDVTSIGDYAFYGCTGLSELILPSSLTSIGSYAFGNCNNLSWVKISDMAAWCAIVFSDAYANPIYYANHFYLNNNEVVNLTIPSSVSNIKDYAFIGLTSLLSVTIPNSVTSIGSNAFSNCTNLTSVTINNSALASATYTSSNNLKNIFGAQVTSYTFGANVTTLGSYALSGCANMTSVKFLGPVTSIGLGAFSSCSGLTRVYISNLAAWCGIDFASAGANPLYYAHHLYSTSGSEITSLVIPSSVTYIGKYAFTGCEGLTSVTMPNSVTSIGVSAFTNCNGLNRVNISNLTAWCGINFGDGLSNPLAKAHRLYLNNSEVTELTIPSDVTTIKSFAFKDCTGLTKLTIHDAVTHIGTSAFTGCTNLAEIHSDATIPPVLASSYTFYNVPKTIPVYVPIGCVPTYQDALYWSSFTNYVGAASPETLMVTVPYVQEFNYSYKPSKWTSYEGQLNWNSSLDRFTANLSTNNSHWDFGYVNGVFLSTHAWANIGNANHAFWLVSPIIHLDNTTNMLSFKMALTQASGLLPPVTPGAQNDTRIFVLVSIDHGVTWTKLQAWKHATTGTYYTEIESLSPHGATFAYDLESYASPTNNPSQDIMIGFYLECTNNDAANRVHIDDFRVEQYDKTAAPTNVSVSEIGGHTAKVSWAPGNLLQSEWDVAVAPSWILNPDIIVGNENTILVHVNGFSYNTTMTGLTSGLNYYAWVRFNDGTTTTSWTRSQEFSTAEVCGHPTITEVQATQTTLFVSWERGEPDQNSFTVYVYDSDYPAEFVVEGATSILIDISDLFSPEQDYSVYVGTICSDNGNEIFSQTVSGTIPAWPTLSVNDGTSTSYTAVINAYGTSSGYGSTQFVVPAAQLEGMEYSTIHKLQFYCSNVQNGRPWGTAYFEVRLAMVDFSNYDEFCGESFYNWDNMWLFFDGWLDISDGVMTITPASYLGRPFHYEGGDLLVGIRQTENDSGSQTAQWYGISNTPMPMSGYIDYQYDENIVQCENFAPKVTFGYETDHYNSPTDFVALPQNSNEVYFSWMPCEGATSYEIEISPSEYFDGLDDQLLSIPTGYEYNWVDVNGFLDEESGYYARIRSIYNTSNGVYGSSWSDAIKFITPAYCAPPTDLTATVIGNLRVKLDWIENGDATEWVIAFKATDETNEQGFAVYEHPFVLEAPYIEPNKTYTVRVRPICSDVVFVWSNTATFSINNIFFDDPNVKALCVAKWDTGGDGELSFAEAAAVTSLENVFQNKTNITSFNELQYFTGLTTINNNAFYNCYQLASVVVPNGVTTLDSYAFQLCTNLQTVTLPTTLTEIKSNAFRNCNALSAIGFPESLTTIGTIAFYGCTSLTSIFIPASVTTINENPFAKTGLESIYVDPANTVFDSRDDCNAIMKKANNQLVVGCKNTVIPSTALSIWDNAFRECEGLTSIYIPENIRYIYSYAFYKCTALTSVNIPSQVSKIYLCSFYGCSGLSSITIPSGVTEIQQSAFNGCTGLTEIMVLASTPPTIGVTAFAGVDNTIPVYVPCESLGAYHNADGWSDFSNMIDPCIINFADQNVKALCVANWDTSGDGELSYTEAAAVTTLGEVFKNNDDITTFNELQYFTGLTSIVDHAFGGCGNLTSVVIPVGVTSIGTSAFSYCPNLTTVILPEGVTSIGNYAFMNDALLTGIDFPESLSSIGAQSFDHCTSMTYLFIPASVTSITYTAFLGCSGLEYISVAPGNTVYDSRDDCNAIIATNSNQLRIGCKNTIIPNTVTSIGPSAFRANTALTSINLPESIAAINDYAFYECSALSSITLPASLTSLGQRVFYNCVGLQSITVEAAIPPTIVTGNQDSFYGVDKTIPVYVPCASFGDYQNCNGSPWGGFTNIVSEGCVQTITLNGGWNWWTPTLEMELGDIETNLGNRGILILSQNEGFARYENGWNGTLSEVGLGKMYKIQLTAGDPVFFEVEGGLSSGTTVTIEPGFNWIGYTGPAGLSITEALGSFEPNDGDEIIDENGDSVYYDGENWEGNFTSLNPGKGYLYHSVANETKTITF